MPAGIAFVCAEAVDWLVEHLVPDTVVTKIIPAIPHHLAVEWLKRKISLARGMVSEVEITAEMLEGFSTRTAPQSRSAGVVPADFLSGRLRRARRTLYLYWAGAAHALVSPSGDATLR